MAPYCLPPFPEMVGLMYGTAERIVQARRMAKRAKRKKRSARQIEMRLVLEALRGVDQVAEGLAGAERKVAEYRPGDSAAFVPGEWKLALAPAAGGGGPQRGGRAV